MKKFVVSVGCSILLSACGGGGGDSGSNNEDSSLNLEISPNFNVDANSSHTLQSTDIYVDVQAVRNNGNQVDSFAIAVSYADFDGDGDTDVFVSPGDGSENAMPSELYLNDGSDNFTLDTNFFDGTPPGGVHPRKALTGDFNGDGAMDVFVVGHGYDIPPYPGEAPYVVLSSDVGFILGTGLEEIVGFHHGGASADIDADGDIDVFVTDGEEPFFLINDGTGYFTKDSSRVGGIDHAAIFTAELVDVDQDGYVDLLVGGHEYQGFATRILWGDSTGYYSTSKSTVIPSVTDNQVVIDIDVADIDNDGDKDIVFYRTGDGTGALQFYQGYYLQIAEQTSSRSFNDATTQRFATAHDPSGAGFNWIRLQDFNDDGHVDIVVDDAANNQIWYNDGSGHFL